MGHMVTPSPTPPITRLVASASPFVDEVSDFPTQSMNSSRHGHWGYGTPPLEDDALCGHEPLLGSKHDTSLASRWKSSKSIDMGQQPSGSGLTFSDFHTFVSEPKESQTRPNSPNRPLMQDHSGMKNYVVGNQIGDHRFEWDSPRSTRQRKTTGSKIAKRGKKAQFPDLVEPLSEWAKANGVKPKDVHGFATRDIEKRIAQAIKNGYVKRNLNVFFLYKRAYGAVAQSWMEMHHPTLAKTQPPLVTLVGESWAKESKEFKQSYTFYSELEKDGLRSAFPHYKYKPGAKKGQLGVTAVAEESHGASAEDSHRHKRDESRAGFSGPGQQAYRESSMGPPDQDGSLVQAQANENVHMSRLPANLRAQPLFAPQDPHYGPGSWSGSPEPVSILGGYGNSFLYPGRPEWQTGFRGGGPRSASPAYSHHSQQMNIIPIDPSLPDPYTDNFPSRGASEEPGYIVPSQTLASGASDVVSSRAMSVEPLFEEASELADTTLGWQPQLAASRGPSEEPWQEVPDSILSSVPVGDRAAHQTQTLASESNEWHLEPIEQDEQLQPFTWDLGDWAHDLDGGPLDSIH